MNLADLDRPEGIIEEESIQDADLCVEKTAQNPEDDSVYLFKSLENGELTVPEEAEFDKVSKYYEEVLADQ